ncbi:MAG: hypothetical protein QM699_00385 [Amaricoccus sp.]|uniref:hypothetical protein n=1 Tax=Amaricoccus sp. TaxID=1872485 RepID=UPI0039E250F4
MIRLALALMLALLPWRAVAETAWPPEVSLAVVPDPAPAGGTAGEGPVLGEMVLATLHGEYVGNVAKEELAVPPLPGWSWMQLGPPEWSDAMIGNRAVKVYEVRFAFFPQKAGRQEIGPITHHLIFAGSGGRMAMDARSAPVVFDVAAPPPPPTVATGLRQPFWMPARAVRLTDDWDPAPDRIPPGGWARRTVTLEVAGLPPEALPSAPQMAAGNLFSFVDGEERSVERTPDGPVSRVVWRYRMQPQSTVPADLDNIPVPWFDTSARVWREEMLRGAEIAFAGTSLPKAPGPVARRAVPVGLALGALVGCAALLPRLGRGRGGAGGRVRRRLRAARVGLALRLAEARRDPVAARRALVALLAARGRDPSASGALARLDGTLFGRPGEGPGQGPQDGLAGLARQAWRER